MLGSPGTRVRDGPGNWGLLKVWLPAEGQDGGCRACGLVLGSWHSHLYALEAEPSRVLASQDSL